MVFKSHANIENQRRYISNLYNICFDSNGYCFKNTKNFALHRIDAKTTVAFHKRFVAYHKEAIIVV